MPMTKEEIQESLSGGFSNFAKLHRRAGLQLGGRLGVLKNEAKLAKLQDGEFDALVRAEMEATAHRMAASAEAFHPVVPLVSVEED